MVNDVQLRRACVTYRRSIPAHVFSGQHDELTGLIVKDTSSSRLHVRECTVRSRRTSPTSTLPFCNGLRQCLNRHREVLSGREAVVAEWHTHPGSGFSPPTPSDMYQLLLASVIHGSHNVSVVFSHAGIYILEAPDARTRRMVRREILRFFDDSPRTLTRCDEPIVRSSRAFPYLHSLLRGPVRLFKKLSRALGTPKQKAGVYGKWVRHNLHIRFRFIPSP